MDLTIVINVSTNIPIEISAELKYQASVLGIELQTPPSIGFGVDIPPETVLIIIEALKNVSYSTLYDLIKFCTLSISTKFNQAFGKKPKEFVFVCKGDKYSIKTDFNLTQDNIDQLVNSIAKRIAED